jgi:cell division cycle 2-like protein
MAATTTAAAAGRAMTDDEACPGLDSNSSGVRYFQNFRILWIFVQLSLATLVLFRNLWFRLAAQLKRMLPSAGGAAGTSTTTLTASRIADIITMIDEHTIAGTMTGKQVATFCAMINAHCHDNAEEILREGGAVVGTTRSYKLMRRLGKGGCGRVVMAQRRSTGQTVAVKTIRARRHARRPDIGELLKEACFLAACRGHPCLVGLHGIVRDPGSREYCLVMDYVGPSLSDALDRRVEEHDHGFPEADVRKVMRQLLTGAAAMHERGIIHRDIKPSNILVDANDSSVVRLCDYGCAMPIAKADPPYGQAGTVSYMAPEMLLEKPDYDERVDLWSLGCVMAELLSGESPFDSVKTTDTLEKIFDLLGMPGKKSWQGFKSTILADQVQQWRAPQQVQRQDRLRKLFPEVLLSAHGFHVLQGLLTCNPSKRLTVAAALQCPWFKIDAPEIDDEAADVRSVGTEVGQPHSIVTSWVLTSAWARFFREVALSSVRLPIAASAWLRNKASSKHIVL